MNTTAHERVERQRKMFGQTVEEMQAQLREAVRWQYAYGMKRAQKSPEDAREVIAFSLLSDAQELLAIALGAGEADRARWGEEVRQMLNRAKWILGSDEAIAAAAGGWTFATSGGERPALFTVPARRAG